MTTFRSLITVLALCLALAGCTKTKTHTVYSNDGNGFQQAGIVGTWTADEPAYASGALEDAGAMSFEFTDNDEVIATWPSPVGPLRIRLYRTNMLVGQQYQWVGYHNTPDTAEHVALWRVMLIIAGPANGADMFISITDEGREHNRAGWIFHGLSVRANG